MTDAADQIVDAEKVTSIFGCWPSFHDAEVLDIVLRRSTGDVGNPSIDARIHVFRMTSEVSPSGHFVCDRHTIVTLRFTDVDSVKLEYFNHQNALTALEFNQASPDQKIWVGFLGAYGLDGELLCTSAQVLSAEPGIPSHSAYRKAEA